MASSTEVTTVKEAVEFKKLTKREATALTKKVKEEAHALWADLVTLYNGKAHEVLGFENWEDYCQTHFGWSPARGSQLRLAGEVVAELTKGEVAKGEGELTIVSLPANEATARELSPVLKKAPAKLDEVWAKAVAEAKGDTPTAAEVRAIVDKAAPEVRPRERKGASGPTGTRSASKKQRAQDMRKRFDEALAMIHSNARVNLGRVEDIEGVRQSQHDKWVRLMNEAIDSLSDTLAALEATAPEGDE